MADERQVNIRITATSDGVAEAAAQAQAALNGLSGTEAGLGKNATKSTKALKEGTKELGKVTGAAKKGEEAIGGFGRGVLSSTLHVGGLITPLRLLGTVIGSLAVGSIAIGIQAMKEYDDVLDKFSTTTSNAANVMQTYDKANMATHTSASAVAATIEEMLRLNAYNAKAYSEFVPSLATYWEEAGVDARAATAELVDLNMAYGRAGNTFGELTRMFAGAARQEEITVARLLEGTSADSARIFQQYGYTIEEYLASVAKLRKGSYEVKTFSQAMERLLYELSGGDASMAKQKWDAIVATIGGKNTTEALMVLKDLDVRGTSANEMIRAARSGYLGKGLTVRRSERYLPSGAPQTKAEWAAWQAKHAGRTIRDIIDPLSTTTLPPSEIIAGLERLLGNTSARMTGLGLKAVAPGVIDMWTGMMEGIGVTGIDDKFLDSTNATTIIKYLIDELKKEQGPSGYLPIKAPSPIFQSASAGFGTDYGGSLAVQGLNAALDANEKLTIDSGRAAKEQIDNAELVLAYNRDAYYRSADAADYAYSFIRWKSRDSWGSMVNDTQAGVEKVKPWWQSLKDTAIKALDSIGIDGDKLWNDLLTGFERIGWEAAEALGFPYTKEELKQFIKDAGNLLRGWGLDLDAYWSMLTGKVTLTVEDINKAALARLQGLFGDVVNMLGEMFATGKWDWEALWKKTWQTLLGIVVDYGIKMILAAEAVQTLITSIMALGPIAGLAAGAGLLLAGGVSYGWVSLFKSLTSGGEGAGANPYPATYGTPSGPGASNVNVSFAGANIYGTIDDRAATKIGESLTRSMAFRGVQPLAYS